MHKSVTETRRKTIHLYRQSEQNMKTLMNRDMHKQDGATVNKRPHLLSALATALSAALLAGVGPAAAGEVDEFFKNGWGLYVDIGRKTIDEINTVAGEVKHDQLVIITNRSNERRKAYWTAAGCAGLKDGVAVLCHAEEVAAGASARYVYRKGTSSRNVQIRDLTRTSKNDTSGQKNCDVKRDVNEGGDKPTDIEFFMSCTTADRKELNTSSGGAVTNSGKTLGDRNYAMTVRSAEPDMITFYYGSARCTQTVGGVSNVCRSIIVPANGTVTIPVSESEKPTAAVVGFKGKTRQDAQQLKGRETVEIVGGKLMLR
jgi:hypothetical protein